MLLIRKKWTFTHRPCFQPDPVFLFFLGKSLRANLPLAVAPTFHALRPPKLLERRRALRAFRPAPWPTCFFFVVFVQEGVGSAHAQLIDCPGTPAELCFASLEAGSCFAGLVRIIKLRWLMQVVRESQAEAEGCLGYGVKGWWAFGHGKLACNGIFGKTRAIRGLHQAPIRHLVQLYADCPAIINWCAAFQPRSIRLGLP